jgi:hypothetical protein
MDPAKVVPSALWSVHELKVTVIACPFSMPATVQCDWVVTTGFAEVSTFSPS